MASSFLSDIIFISIDCSKGCERDMEQIYCAALTSLLNYDAPLWVPRFRETFGSCRAAWEAGRKDLAGAGLLSRELSQVWDSARKEALPERIYDYCQKHQVRLLGRWSPGYPPLLAQLSAPPPVLYCKGELPKEESALAIVGSRKATDYGLGAAGQFARAAAAEGVPVISGGAYGIDAAAHRAVLDAGGKTVAVLGGGLEELYPRRHLRLFDRICQEGALVTEYDPWTPPLPQNFPLRNRIIVGLSKAVLVVEAAIRSGAMSTAHAAVDENRELFAVPGPISSETSQGTHRLLKQGARLADDPEEILEFLLGPRAERIPPQAAETDLFRDLSPSEQKKARALCTWLQKHQGRSLEEIADHFPWPLLVLSTLLLELELMGRVQRNSRNRYNAV